MADKDLEDGPSLELPRLFRRKKARKSRDRDDEPRRVDETATPAPPETPQPGVDDVAQVTMPLPVPAAEPAVDPRPEPDSEPARAPEPEPAPQAESTTTHAMQPAEPATGTTRVEAPPAPPRLERSRKRIREPGGQTMSPALTAVLVGAVVAALGIGLTYLGLLGCEAVRGTQSCGGPGLLVMLVIMVAMVVAGAAALKAAGVPHSGSLSFLGFGILTVVVLTFLLEHLYEPWALVALPLISAASYGIAHSVTTRFTDAATDSTPLG